MKLSSMFAGRLSHRPRGSGFRLLGLATAILFFASLQAFAQEATIVGTVTDPSGAAVPNVTVTLTNSETGQIDTEKTNDTGEYVAPSLRIGHYTVQAEAQGFTMAKQSGLVLNVGDRRRVDFRLKIGGTQESVTVEATQIAVQADSGEISSVVTGRDRKSTRLNYSHPSISYAVFCLKKKI